MPGKLRDPFGGVSAILLGVSYLFIGLAVMFNPVLRAPNTEEALRTLIAVPIWTQLETILFGVGSLVGLAVVQAVSRRVEAVNLSLVQWASAVGMLAFALVAIKDFRSFTMVAEVQRLYREADPVVRMTFVELMTPITDLDPLGFTYAGIGLWMTTVNVLAIRSGAWPRYLAYLGAPGGLMYVAIMIGRASGLMPLFLIAVMVGSLLGPVWYILMGMHLLRGGQPVPSRLPVASDA
ncbi:MAG: DUF4386 family protein [Chloroflexaceae bacterium]|nr:DUF4386 family protein [Chloroflexaceae bacterium]